jgi:hypothetical protein
MGSVEILVLGDYVIRRKQADLRKLIGEGLDGSGRVVKAPLVPNELVESFSNRTFRYERVSHKRKK